MIGSIVHPLEILFGGDTSMACAPNAEMHADCLHGLFAGDTRVLSTYRLMVGGHAWRLLSRFRCDPTATQWDMQNPTILAPTGDIPEGTLHLRLRRRVLGSLHDDLTVTSFADRTVAVRLSVQLDSDFADIFQIKSGSTPPRLSVRRVARDRGICLLYERQGFRRGVHIAFTPSDGVPTFVGTQIVFDLMLKPHQPWSCCVESTPDIDGKRLVFGGDPHGREAVPGNTHVASLETAPLLASPFARGSMDLARLAVTHGAATAYIAAGAPWFLALFGRDTLVTSLMASTLGSWHVRGALSALADFQAHERDDFRDAQPGKIAHELRRGELARFGAIPHTPYYGTHDAPALYVLALWNAFRWTGDEVLLRAYLPAAEEALRWCDEFGDEDGDGLLEYRTRSSEGYRNQSWKDAHDAIPHEDGTHAELPIATVELQGYWYAARLAMAELYDALGQEERAGRLRAAARELRELVEELFWMDDEGTYALALDGRKRRVRSVASNPGHLLWCGLPSPDRSRRIAERLLAEDMFSGYGIRTLSSRHASYNPLSYQLGSVWPHDNALIAAGLFRYGLQEGAARILEGVLDAAANFEGARLPELFCGFAREDGPPVPYEKANVPQAWAAAAPILAAQLFLGLVPDVARGRCYLSPWLPEWLSFLELDDVEIGNGKLQIRIERRGNETSIVRATHPSLNVVREMPTAPLWGSPP